MSFRLAGGPPSSRSCVEELRPTCGEFWTSTSTTERCRVQWPPWPGTGTSAHIVPATGTVAVLFTQSGADSPVPPEWTREFWRYSVSAVWRRSAHHGSGPA
jgi:hypothetical protein